MIQEFLFGNTDVNCQNDLMEFSIITTSADYDIHITTITPIDMKRYGIFFASCKNLCDDFVLDEFMVRVSVGSESAAMFR